MDSRTNNNQQKVEDVIKTVKKMKWRWVGHIARRTDGRWATNVLQWIPREKKRPRRHPNVRWVDEIKRFSGATWMRISPDRDMWKEKGEAVDRKRLTMMMIIIYIYIYIYILRVLQ